MSHQRGKSIYIKEYDITDTYENTNTMFTKETKIAIHEIFKVDKHLLLSIYESQALL